MKFYRNAIILVVVLAILVGGYVFVSKKKGSVSSDSATTTTKGINVITLDSGKISKISLIKKDITLDFIKGKTDWELSSPAGIKTSSDNVYTVTENAKTLSASKIVEEKSSNLSQYGLDNPAAEIVLDTSDNKTQTLDLGNKTPTNDSYYLVDKATNKVYIIDSYYGDQLLDAKNYIRDKTLFHFTTDKDGLVTDANLVAMDRGGKLLFSSKLDSDKNWVLTAPFEANAQSDNISPIIDAFSKLAVSSFIEDNAADLNKYGLANPAYALEVDTAKAKNRILLGVAKPGSNEMYALIDGTKDVFTIDPSSLTFLDKPFKEIIEPFVFITNINDVTRIDVTMDGRTDTSIVQTDKSAKPDTDKDKFYFNGKLATAKDKDDRQPFRAYYQSLIGVLLDSVDIGALPVGKPEITIEYTLSKAPGKMKVEFISKDKDYYYAMRNGKYTNVLVLKSQFDGPDGIRESYKKLMAVLK